jgi:hypothetical protein
MDDLNTSYAQRLTKDSNAVASDLIHNILSSEGDLVETTILVNEILTRTEKQFEAEKTRLHLNDYREVNKGLVNTLKELQSEIFAKIRKEDELDIDEFIILDSHEKHLRQKDRKRLRKKKELTDDKLTLEEKKRTLKAIRESLIEKYSEDYSLVVRTINDEEFACLQNNHDDDDLIIVRTLYLELFLGLSPKEVFTFLDTGECDCLKFDEHDSIIRLPIVNRSNTSVIARLLMSDSASPMISGGKKVDIFRAYREKVSVKVSDTVSEEREYEFYFLPYEKFCIGDMKIIETIYILIESIRDNMRIVRVDPKQLIFNGNLEKDFSKVLESLKRDSGNFTKFKKFLRLLIPFILNDDMTGPRLNINFSREFKDNSMEQVRIHFMRQMLLRFGIRKTKHKQYKSYEQNRKDWGGDRFRQLVETFSQGSATNKRIVTNLMRMLLNKVHSGEQLNEIWNNFIKNNKKNAEKNYSDFCKETGYRNKKKSKLNNESWRSSKAPYLTVTDLPDVVRRSFNEKLLLKKVKEMNYALAVGNHSQMGKMSEDFNTILEILTPRQKVILRQWTSTASQYNRERAEAEAPKEILSLREKEDWKLIIHTPVLLDLWFKKSTNQRLLSELNEWRKRFILKGNNYFYSEGIFHDPFVNESVKGYIVEFQKSKIDSLHQDQYYQDMVVKAIGKIDNKTTDPKEFDALLRSKGFDEKSIKKFYTDKKEYEIAFNDEEALAKEEELFQGMIFRHLTALKEILMKFLGNFEDDPGSFEKVSTYTSYIRKLRPILVTVIKSSLLYLSMNEELEDLILDQVRSVISIVTDSFYYPWRTLATDSTIKFKSVRYKVDKSDRLLLAHILNKLDAETAFFIKDKLLGWTTYIQDDGTLYDTSTLSLTGRQKDIIDESLTLILAFIVEAEKLSSESTL